jgi:transcriptional regulator GlxA family with amidase domain
LQDNYRQPLNSQQLAAICGLTVRSFNRRFKAATERTPGQYLAQQRLRVAKELLRESNLAVAEIAYQVGYQDGSHFSRLFKKLLGQTPKQYRDTVRGKLFSLAEKTL